MITVTDPLAVDTRHNEPDVDQKYADLARSLGRCRDFCVVLALALFFGRSLWA
jgi:hypothetical protein